MKSPHRLLDVRVVDVDPLVVDGDAAARLLAISPRTLFTLRQAGEIGHIKIRGAVRYAMSDLERYIADQRVPATAS